MRKHPQKIKNPPVRGTERGYGASVRRWSGRGLLLAAGAGVLLAEQLQAFGGGDGHLAHGLVRHDADHAVVAVDELDRGRLLALGREQLAGPGVDLAAVRGRAMELDVARRVGDDGLVLAALALLLAGTDADRLIARQRAEGGSQTSHQGVHVMLLHGNLRGLQLMLQEPDTGLVKQRSTIEADKRGVYSKYPPLSRVVIHKKSICYLKK